jgi:hypothetical protein
MISARDRAPSLARMCETCVCTVLRDKNSSAATSGLDRPSVTPHLSNQAGHNSPAFHIRRCQDDGVFDRFTALWDEGRGVWGANGTASRLRGHDQARRYLRARQ